MERMELADSGDLEGTVTDRPRDHLQKSAPIELSVMTAAAMLDRHGKHAGAPGVVAADPTFLDGRLSVASVLSVATDVIRMSTPGSVRRT